jgi:hypothetical protein
MMEKTYTIMVRGKKCEIVTRDHMFKDGSGWRVWYAYYNGRGTCSMFPNFRNYRTFPKTAIIAANAILQAEL